MTFKEHISITRRAVRLLWQLGPSCTSTLIASSILEGICPYVPVIFSAMLIDGLAAGAPIGTLALLAGLTVGLTFAANALWRWTLTAFNTRAGEAYTALEWKFCEKALGMAYENLENRDVKLLLERIRKENQTGYNLFYLHQTVKLLFRSAAQVLGGLGVLTELFTAAGIPLGLRLALAAGLALTAAFTCLAGRQGSRIQTAFMDSCVEANILNDKYNSYTTDYTAGKDIRLYGMEDMLADNYAAIDLQFYKGMQRAMLRNGAWMVPMQALQQLLTCGLYLLLLWAALAGAISVGSIAKYAACLLPLMWGVSNLPLAIQLALTNNQYLKRFFSYFDIPNKMYQGSLTVEKRDDNDYEVEFRDVSFRYPGADSWALRHVSMKFNIGEKLAIVGENGSGKTTFIKLLCRLYDPTEGTILLGGVDIRKYDYDEYRRLFAVVFQDFQLPALTLGQNVAVAKEYDEARVRRCLEQAGFGQRLAGLPEGCGTYLYSHYAEEGVEISGGEAQKIALARALYKNAPFIILDEPTSALDPEAEYEVYTGFDAIVGDKTAVYISHRLASCRFCDAIAVFSGGQLVQRGTHAELLARHGGKYHALWTAQAQYYT